MNNLTLLVALLLAALAAPSSAVRAAEPVAIDLATRTWQGIPGLERTAKGRVFVSWFTGGAKEPEPLNTVVLSHSDDGGKTFSSPQAIALPLDDGTRCYDPCLWIDPKGRLWYLFNRSVKDSTRHGVHARICDDPDATPPVWGAEFRVGFESPFSFRMNKPIVLSSGEWIMPVVHALEPLAAWAGFDPKQVQGVAISADEGETWKLHGAVKTAKAGLENMVVELEDGRLWMLVRTEKVLWESHSADKGRTWTQGGPTTIATPHSRFFIRRLASGNLLLVNHFKFTGRSHLTARLSTDDGKTWNDGLVLDERGGPNFPNGVPGGVSYPDGVQDEDGLIWITYDRDRNGRGEILLARFKEEDVAAGKDVSGAVSLKQVVNKLEEPIGATNPPLPAPPASVRPSPRWTEQAAADATQDFSSIPFEGRSPNRMVCDTTLRRLPDGSWIYFLLAGGDTEPAPENYTAVTRSTDEGRTWTPLAAFEVGFPREGKTIGQGPTELLVIGGRSTLFFSTHSKHWANDWRSWYLTSDDSFRTWSKPMALPGRLEERTFIRPSIVARDGRILMPFQHYVGPDSDKEKPPLDRAFTNPRNGVLISADGGRTWTEHGDVRLTPDDRYFGWAEPTICERADGSILMLIRADKLGGVLYQAVSTDGGRTWPEFASATDIPNPGSKATLFPLGGDAVSLLHNPDPKRRMPLSLWISFDGARTWPYQRVLVDQPGPDPDRPAKAMGSSLNYPDGFVSADRKWLHFAYDDSRHRAVHYSAKLPPLPAPQAAAAPKPASPTVP